MSRAGCEARRSGDLCRSGEGDLESIDDEFLLRVCIDLSGLLLPRSSGDGDLRLGGFSKLSRLRTGETNLSLLVMGERDLSLLGTGDRDLSRLDTGDLDLSLLGTGDLSRFRIGDGDLE